jgi:glycosyltransferase involved in cell wall biosynthesis
LDTNQYQPIEKSIARNALRISDGKFVVGFACSDFHEKRKGAEILLRALESFPSSEIVLVVLGGGLWPRDVSCFETIQIGSIETPRLQSLFYSSLDVFAMPSEVETFGNVAMEAMACETPVVGYPAGGLADVVEDGVTGLFEKHQGSVRGLVEKLEWMRQNPSERMAMGTAARKRVIAKFSDTLMALKYMELYQKLIPLERKFLK